MNHAQLFDLYAPRDPKKVCQVCGADLRTDRRGVLRHKAGEGKRCDDIIRSRMKASAHFSTKTGATGEPKP